jgi:AraC-like DNA-binding protein
MTEPGKDLTIRPELALEGLVSGDLLSQVLARIRLTGDRVYSTRLSPAGMLELNAQSAYVCVATQGTLEIGHDSGAVTLQTGDLALLPRGPRAMHISASTGPAEVVVCCFWFDPDSMRDMLFAMPSLIHLTKAQTNEWLTQVIQFLLIEATDFQPGSALMVSRLIDLIVIRTLRTWVHHGKVSSWLGGLADVRISRALKALHDNPRQALTIDELAGVAGMSRSNFADRFTALVGMPPLRYRNEWRLALAREMLANRGLRVGEVGFAVGYESEAAFSRAYKSFFGHAPSEARPSPQFE